MGFVSSWLMEIVEALDALEDEEVGKRCAVVNIGQRFNRPCIKVRSDLRVIHLGHAAIFLASQMPPTRPSAICRMEAARFSSTRPNSYLVVRRSPVATGIEVAPRNERHFLRPVRRCWLLEPQGVVLFDLLGKPDGTRCRELAMGAEQQVGLAAHGFAQQAAEL